MAEQVTISVSAEERDAFLTINAIPQNSAETYAWLAFQAGQGCVQLYQDEIQVAREMAERAGLHDLAGRLQ